MSVVSDAYVESLKRYQRENDAAVARWEVAKREATEVCDADRNAAKDLPPIDKSKALLQVQAKCLAGMRDAKAPYEKTAGEALIAARDAVLAEKKALMHADGVYDRAWQAAKEEYDRVIAEADRIFVTDLIPDAAAYKVMTRYQDECSAIETEFAAGKEALTKKFQEDLKKAEGN